MAPFEWKKFMKLTPEDLEGDSEKAEEYYDKLADVSF